MIEKINVPVYRGHELANVYDAYTSTMPIICPILGYSGCKEFGSGKEWKEKKRKVLMHHISGLLNKGSVVITYFRPHKFSRC